jgi:plastocyanin
MEIKGFAFGALTAKAGETITVTNGDSAKHTVTANDGSFEVKVDAGGTATFTVDAPGTYEIHCEVHPRMKGTITIN